MAIRLFIKNQPPQTVTAYNRHAPIEKVGEALVAEAKAEVAAAKAPPLKPAAASKPAPKPAAPASSTTPTVKIPVVSEKKAEEPSKPEAPKPPEEPKKPADEKPEDK